MRSIIPLMVVAAAASMMTRNTNSNLQLVASNPQFMYRVNQEGKKECSYVCQSLNLKYRESDNQYDAILVLNSAGLKREKQHSKDSFQKYVTMGLPGEAYIAATPEFIRRYNRSSSLVNQLAKIANPAIPIYPLNAEEVKLLRETNMFDLESLQARYNRN